VTGRSRFFARWLARSVRGTLASGAVATASLAVTSAMVFTLVAVSAGVPEQLGAELRAYGANVLLLPRMAPLRYGMGAFELGAIAEERTLEERALAALPAELVDGVAAGLLVRARLGGADVGAAGYDLPALRRLNPLWRVSPRWPEGGGEAMAGSSAAARLGLRPGDRVSLGEGARRAEVRIAAIVETGGGEDENLFLPLALAQELSGKAGQVSLALVRARLDGAPAEAVAAALERAVPGSEARTLRQVAQAEASLLEKVERLLLLVTVALGAATAFTVAGTLGVLLLARRQEIGLCLALGASPRTVGSLLLSEAALSGLAGGLAGCLVGAAAAETIARGVFGSLVPLGADAALWAVGAALAVSLGAAAWPVRRAVGHSPCDILRSA
jgi:putative ABC transport system permease protein